jgi:hypothetical protein
VYEAHKSWNWATEADSLNRYVGAGTIGASPVASLYADLRLDRLISQVAGLGASRWHGGGKIATFIEGLKRETEDLERRLKFGHKQFAAELYELSRTYGTAIHGRQTPEEILAFIDACKPQTYDSVRPATVAAFRYWLRLTRVKRAIHRIEIIITRLSPVTATFCGITWARRIWHLIHGSHPPRLEA